MGKSIFKLLLVHDFQDPFFVFWLFQKPLVRDFSNHCMYINYALLFQDMANWTHPYTFACIQQIRDGGKRQQVMCTVAFILHQLRIYLQWLLQIMRTVLFKVPVDIEVVLIWPALSQNLLNRTLSSQRQGKVKVMEGHQLVRDSCRPLEHLFSMKGILFLILIHLPGAISAHLIRPPQEKPCHFQSWHLQAQQVSFGVFS